MSNENYLQQVLMKLDNGLISGEKAESLIDELVLNYLGQQTSDLQKRIKDLEAQLKNCENYVSTRIPK